MDTGLAGKQVLVMGLGRFGGGVDVVQYASRAGAQVVVTDKTTPEKLGDSLAQLRGLPDVEYHLGRHEPDDFTAADVVIANPAVPPDNEYLQIARRAGRRVTSQMGLFFQSCPAPIIGITGANGKSTTTTLTAHLLERARPPASPRPYEKVWLSGNIGDRPLLTILDQIGPRDLVVLEISSFQVEQLAEVGKAPRVALLTNLTPNHLDRYGTFEAYCAAKEGLFQYQTLDARAPAISIFNAEDEIACTWLRKYQSQRGRQCLQFSADDVSDEIRAVYALPGRANRSNLAAATALARCFGVSDQSIRDCLGDFKALSHRLELVGDTHGVRWYNDSKATTPEGTMVALSAFEGPKILIAGGYDKHTPFDELGKRIAREAKAAILLGQTARQIAGAMEAVPAEERRAQVRFASSLAEAVGLAHLLAAPGDVVLLSPACASYDMFENYQQRGRQFAELVRQIG
ncbi:MAG: UDP-N-acetylmuramoyl-L-alanine--D-glutamate ligase [Planctomycetes bacterium]|jgi:UDP-N-acetylmuramoylalanine--D-glutamate ligase|nr:UDP-N-acetylmuramoyl-L-alanine--D-glutamate ligase [Planctomycetota bacterium]